MTLGISLLGEKFVWVVVKDGGGGWVGGSKVSLVLALAQNQDLGFGFGLGPS